MKQRRQISVSGAFADGASWPATVHNLQDRAAVLKSRKDNMPGLAMGRVRRATSRPTRADLVFRKLQISRLAPAILLHTVR
jgi:hypothetical protein